ncbi:hypothetical protein [Nocardiopsis dassonvillei]|uniref:hypothetical protein n=1 Tax=Nocardiopsis dassonvillei TaxID=2014 RepID=UPI0036301622
MAFVHSKQSRVLVNSDHVSGSITAWNVTSERSVSEVTTILDEGAKFIPGLKAGSISLSGLFDGAEGAFDEIITDTDGVLDGLLTTVCPAGFDVGSPCFITVSNSSGYTIDSPVADAVSVSVEATPQVGVDRARLHHGHTAETATGEAASVDHTADLSPTTSGGVASLHVTAASGTTPTLDVKLQHSVDDAVWVDLASFTQATAATSERITVAGTVERYTRASWTIAGTSPEFTFAAAFARR